ncbi:MAG: hypothetical protein EON59_00975 [Alphaproteobacteria bacterium]|nr:MAG: hypothetical protein EON59_00975 [Alphaproteobacteria bacterium]
MLALFDTPSLERALSLPLDPKLRRLLHQQVDHLNALDFAVRDTTYFLIIEAGTTMEEIVDELGWSPLVDLDGNRFGATEFNPSHEYVEHREGWYIISTTGGNDALFTLIVANDDAIDRDLLALCHIYAH